MKYLGDFTAGKTIICRFNTHKADGTPITLAGSPAVLCYKNSTTESASTGITLTVDYDSRTGLHHVAIDTSLNSSFFTSGEDFDVVITGGTVDSISVVGTVVGTFSLANRSALRPATAGRTVVVDGAGLIDANVVKVGPSGSGTAQTAGDIPGRLTESRAAYLDNLTNLDASVSSRATPAGFPARLSLNLTASANTTPFFINGVSNGAPTYTDGINSLAYNGSVWVLTYDSTPYTSAADLYALWNTVTIEYLGPGFNFTFNPLTADFLIPIAGFGFENIAGATAIADALSAGVSLAADAITNATLDDSAITAMQSGLATAATAAAIKAKTDLIPAAGPPSAANYTPERAAALDHLDADISAIELHPTIYPLSATVTNDGRTTTRDLTAYQFAGFEFTIAVTDKNKNPVDLTGHLLAFIIGTAGQEDADFAIRTDDDPEAEGTMGEITVGGTNNNQVTIAGLDAITQEAAELVYNLRDLTTDRVLQAGAFTILEAHDAP